MHFFSTPAPTPAPGILATESWFHLFGSIVTFIYYTHGHVYLCVYIFSFHCPTDLRPTSTFLSLFSDWIFPSFFPHSPRPPIAPPPRFSFGFLIREPPTELELFCLLVADSVSHWKWNGIKWNVKFIVFRGFPCDKRCGTGCGSWRLKGVQRREVFSGKTAGINRNKTKQCQRIAFSLTISNVIYMRTYAAPTVLLAVLSGSFTLLAFYFSFICIYSLLLVHDPTNSTLATSYWIKYIRISFFEQVRYHYYMDDLNIPDIPLSSWLARFIYKVSK